MLPRPLPAPFGGAPATAMSRCLALVLLALLALAASVPAAHAQDNDTPPEAPLPEGAAEPDAAPRVTVDAGVTLTSRFIYRGLNLGQGPQVQPRLALNAGGFQAAVWSSHPVARPADQSAETLSGAENYREVNVWLLYTLDIGVGTLTPYVQNHYNPNNGRVSDLDDETTAHAFQTQLTFRGDERSAPVDAMVGYVFYGNEAADVEGSVYLEGGYRFAVGDLAVRTFVGGVPGRSPFNGVTDSGPHVTNVGLSAARSLQITDGFSLPLGVAFVVNPYTEDAFAAVNVSL